MLCSILEPLPSGGLGGGRKDEQHIGLPIRNQAGQKVTTLSSTTMGANDLKEIRDHAKAMEGGKGLPEYLQVERWEL